MMSLDTVTRIARKASWNTRTLGVALTSCVVPRVGMPVFISKRMKWKSEWEFMEKRVFAEERLKQLIR